MFGPTQTTSTFQASITLVCKRGIFSAYLGSSIVGAVYCTPSAYFGALRFRDHRLSSGPSETPSTCTRPADRVRDAPSWRHAALPVEGFQMSPRLGRTAASVVGVLTCGVTCLGYARMFAQGQQRVSVKARPSSTAISLSVSRRFRLFFSRQLRRTFPLACRAFCACTREPPSYFCLEGAAARANSRVSRRPAAAV